MKYNLEILSNEDLKKLNEIVDSSLSNPTNPNLASMDEYQQSTTFFKPFDNKELSNFINNITGYTTSQINSLFYITYNEGDKLPAHRDRRNPSIKQNPEHSISYSFLLDMCEEGGEFLLENQDVKFNIPGQYLWFDGWDIVHEIKQVKKGKRKVLVVWYRVLSESKLF
jgi:predicted 2-oxoglutarate/Fe(II)-dependent dioxygenase YbiX